MIASGLPQDSILGPLLFIIYLNDLPYGLHQGNNPVICGDCTSVSLTANSETELKKKMKNELYYMTGWFSGNGLVLNMEKTNITKFTPNNRQNEAFQIMYQNRLLFGTDNNKF
jgi:hypothetical protein